MTLIARWMAPQKSGFVADRAAFHYFYLQKTILREAFAGIFLSMLLAFVVLTIATGNYIVAGFVGVPGCGSACRS